MKASPVAGGSVPRLSIGLPVYNGANYLRAAVDSILEQDFTDFELIISDNASSDDTAAICRAYASKDRRVRYLRSETNIGAAANFNRVFECARSNMFKWAAHDDVLLPGFLRRCVEVLEQAPPTVVLVATKAEIIDEAGQKIAKDWRVERLDTRHPRPHQRVADVLRNVDWATAQFGLFRSEALRKTRLIDRFAVSDYALLLEVAILGSIWEIPETLFQRRYHEGISTNANKTQAEFLQWFDPAQKASLLLPNLKPELRPRLRLLLEYVRSIRRLPLAPVERALCFSVAIFYWFSRESRRLAREYVGRFLRKCREAFAAVSGRLGNRHAHRSI